MEPWTIAPARTWADREDASRLFRRYATSLSIDLAYQGFDAELAGLPGKYAPPRGELLIARDSSGQALACVGIRPLGEAPSCEMKRLFVMPEARGSGLGRRLAEAAIAFARASGFADMRLDTLPSMASAIELYERLGFRHCPPYYEPTPPGTIFMVLKM